MKNTTVKNHTASSLSSRKLENSEQLQKAINLGKLIVKELELEPGVDTLQKWMAHYIAEQIVVAEIDKSQEAKELCFNTILKVWERRRSLPTGTRPFENFEELWETLERLDPKNHTPYYANSNKTLEGTDKNIDSWLELVSNIDYAARSLIRYSLSAAVESAMDDKTADWINTTYDLDQANEVTTLLVINRAIFGDDKEKPKEEYEIEELNSFLTKLDGFTQTTEAIRSIINTQLFELKKKI